MGIFPAVFTAVLLFLFPVIAFAQNKDAADSFAKVNGEKIWFQIKGAGEPVVLIPGGPGSTHEIFLPWFNVLSRDFRVVYFDAFGRGKSSWAKNTEEYSFHRDVDDLEGLRPALGFNKWSVVSRFLAGTR